MTDPDARETTPIRAAEPAVNPWDLPEDIETIDDDDIDRLDDLDIHFGRHDWDSGDADW